MAYPLAVVPTTGKIRYPQLIADNEVFLTIALPGGLSAAEETRAWRLQCLREADGVQSVVVVEEDKARCGPFLLGDAAAVPPLLYAFACAAADATVDDDGGTRIMVVSNSKDNHGRSVTSWCRATGRLFQGVSTPNV